MRPKDKFADLVNRIRTFWGAELSFRARLISIGHLFAGSMSGSILGMLAFMVTARALGPQDFGILALTFSYARAIQLLITFQTWQPLIKYGAELQAADEREDMRSLLKFGLLVDFGGATTAYAVAIVGALTFGKVFGIEPRELGYVVIYSTILLFQITSFPTAVMRLYGRFRMLAYAPLIATSLRLILAVTGLVAHAPLVYFVVIWSITQVISCLILVVLSFIELNRHGVRKVLAAPLAGVTRKFPGLWRFTLGTNAELTIRTSAYELDTLMVGFLAGPAAAGLYHIAKRLGRLGMQLGVQVQAVIYPDVARLWASGNIGEFRRTVLQTELMLMALGIVFITGTTLTIRPVLDWTAGVEFSEAAPLAITQMIAVAMMLSGSAFRSALLSMGRQPTVLKIVIVATLGFHAVAWTTIPVVGALGANLAHCTLATIWVGLLTLSYRASFTGRRMPIPKSSPAVAGPGEGKA